MLHEDPDFLLINVHEEVVVLVEVVHLMQEHDRFLFAETQFLKTSPIRIWFGTRVFESLLQKQREFALFVVHRKS